MLEIRRFEKEDITRVVAFEQELRRQEPDTYFWRADDAYRKQLESAPIRGLIQPSLSLRLRVVRSSAELMPPSLPAAVMPPVSAGIWTGSVC